MTEPRTREPIVPPSQLHDHDDAACVGPRALVVDMGEAARAKSSGDHVALYTCVRDHVPCTVRPSLYFALQELIGVLRYQPIMGTFYTLAAMAASHVMFRWHDVLPKVHADIVAQATRDNHGREREHLGNVRDNTDIGNHAVSMGIVALSVRLYTCRHIAGIVALYLPRHRWDVAWALVAKELRRLDKLALLTEPARR